MKEDSTGGNEPAIFSQPQSIYGGTFVKSGSIPHMFSLAQKSLQFEGAPAISQYGLFAALQTVHYILM